MNNEEAKTLHERCVIYARTKGYHQDAEDFAQDMIMRKLEGKARAQRISYAFTDYLRRAYGDFRMQKHPGKAQFRSYDDRNNTQKAIDESNANIDFAECLKILTRREFRVWKYLRIDELNSKKVAKKMKLSVYQVYDTYRNVKEKLKRFKKEYDKIGMNDNYKRIDSVSM